MRDSRKDTSSDITFNLCYIALNNKQNRTVFGVTDSKSGFHDCLRGQNKPHIRYSSLNSWIYLFFKSEQLEGVLWYRVFKMARTKCTYEFFVIQVLLRSITLGSITSYMYQIYIFAVENVSGWALWFGALEMNQKVTNCKLNAHWIMIHISL